MTDRRVLGVLGHVVALSAAASAWLFAGAAQALTVTIDDGGACASWSFDTTNRVLKCSSAPPPPPPAGAPTGCTPSLATLPATLTSAGGTASLNVTGCSPSTGLTFAWTKNGAAFSQSQSPQDTLAANTSTTVAATTSYQVNVCNGSSCTGNLPASPLTATVPVAAGGGGGGGSTSGNICAAQGFSKTIVYNWDWTGANVANIDTIFMSDTTGGTGIGTNGILVIAFTPTAPADVQNLINVDASGYPSPNQTNQLTMSMSTQPCDLAAPAPGTSTSYAPTVTYGVGSVLTPWTSPIPSGVALTPGVRYYINVAGRSGGANTCQPGVFGNCEFRVNLRKPAGH